MEPVTGLPHREWANQHGGSLPAGMSADSSSRAEAPAWTPSEPSQPVEGQSDSVVPAAEPVNGYAILAGVAGLPICTWRYEWEPPGVRHLGPMAQDWKATFDLGNDDDTRIPVVDAHGVALVAIQALHREIAELRAELDALKRSDSSPSSGQP
jgi:hypothetical protein